MPVRSNNSLLVRSRLSPRARGNGRTDLKHCPTTGCGSSLASSVPLIAASYCKLLTDRTVMLLVDGARGNARGMRSKFPLVLQEVALCQPQTRKSLVNCPLVLQDVASCQPQTLKSSVQLQVLASNKGQGARIQGICIAVWHMMPCIRFRLLCALQLSVHS